MKTLKQALNELRATGVIRYDSDIAKALGVGKALISNLINGRGKISNDFKIKFKDVYDIDISDEVHVLQSEFEQTKKAYEQKGYSDKSPPPLDQGQIAHMILSNSSVSLASFDLLCRAVAILENRDLAEVREEASQVTHDKMNVFEDLPKDERQFGKHHSRAYKLCADGNSRSIQRWHAAK